MGCDTVTRVRVLGPGALGRHRYRAAGFVDRNNDSLEHDLSNLARASQRDFVADLFGGRPSLPPPPGGEDADMTATPSKRKKFAGSVTVSRQFRQQMATLMQELDVTRPQFIRCVKPNNDKAPDSLDPHLCLHQLKCVPRVWRRGPRDTRC